jgi:SpoVK/Ycf46/Vps4 family AAA+-type ATPase
MIKEWIKTSYNNYNKLSFNSCIFISGYSGTGKSYLINNISKELDLFIVNINSTNCSSSVQLYDLLYKSYVSSLLQILTNNNQKKIIIIDDFDILMAFDNTINLTLFNFINNNTNKLKHIPIICIINIELVKKIGEIKKKCKIYQIPTLSEIEYFNILYEYNNKLSFNESIDIIIKSDYNIANAIKIVKNINYNNTDELLIIDDLYGNNFNRNKFKEIILKEQWIIPLNFHENLISEILNNRKGNKKLKEDFYKKFIKNFCYFDVLMFNNNEIGIDILTDALNKKENAGVHYNTSLLN